MSRPITEKIIQEHHSCICGRHVIQPDKLTIPHKKLIAAGMKRKKDKATGLPFYLWILKYDTCHCYEDE